MEVAAKLSVDIEGLDYGYGGIAFSWFDPEYGQRSLGIDADGWCFREMPIRSGQGPPQFIEVGSHAFRLKLDGELAEKLELPTNVAFRVDATPEEMTRARRLLSYLEGTE